MLNCTKEILSIILCSIVFCCYSNSKYLWAAQDDRKIITFSDPHLYVDFCAQHFIKDNQTKDSLGVIKWIQIISHFVFKTVMQHLTVYNSVYQRILDQHVRANNSTDRDGQIKIIKTYKFNMFAKFIHLNLSEFV